LIGTHGNNAEAVFANYGARLGGDKNGKMADVVGFNQTSTLIDQHKQLVY